MCKTYEIKLYAKLQQVKDNKNVKHIYVYHMESQKTTSVKSCGIFVREREG